MADVPGGFELDPKVGLFNGGLGSDENTQVLCVHRDEHGRRLEALTSRSVVLWDTSCCSEAKKKTLLKEPLNRFVHGAADRAC